MADGNSRKTSSLRVIALLVLVIALMLLVKYTVSR
jgi:hypothetical protein